MLMFLTVFTTKTYKIQNPNLKEGGEEKEAKGYQDYMFQLRANQITKQLDVNDILKVEEDISEQALVQNKTNALDAIDWNFGGPDNIGGRTRAFLSDKNDGSKLYMGQVSGGFWKSNDDGDSWTQLTANDSARALSIGAIAQSANGDLYYGTGEGIDFRAQLTYSQQVNKIGHGIFKSTDGGNTFNLLPATKPANNTIGHAWTYVNGIAAHPTDNNILFAAINGGCFKTTDAGATWAKPTGLTTSTRVLDVEMSKQGNVVIASTSNNFFISTDGGNTFGGGLNSGSPFPGTAGIGRIAVEIAPSDENFIYVTISNADGSTQGCYKSDNKGASWTKIGIGGGVWDPFGDQGTYNIAFGVHPTNPDMIFLGGQLNLYRYTTAKGWESIAYANQSSLFGKYVHADMHGIFFNSQRPNEMYVVTDGGFFRTMDCTVEAPFFAEKNKNYGTAQCYSVAANRLGQIMFGTQDNGTSIMQLNLQNSQTISSIALGGDGMDCAMSDYHVKYVFGCMQNGRLRRSTDGGTNTLSFKPIFDRNIDAEYNQTSSSGYGAPDEGSNWVAPILLKEKNASKNVLIMGLRDHVWFTQDALSTGNIVWFPMVTIGNAGFSALALSADGKVAYVGTAGGKVFRITGIDLYDTKYQYDNVLTNALADGFSQAGGTNHPLFVRTEIASLGRHITDLECDPSGNLLLITVPNYGNTEFVYRSTNARSAATPTVTSIQNAMPDMPIYSCAILPGSTTKYLVGTDYGVWGTDNGGTSWTDMNNYSNADLSKWHPRAATLEIVIKDKRENKDGNGFSGPIIYTGTHGRGTFYSTSYATKWATNVNNIENEISKSIKVYPNPVVNYCNIEFYQNDAKDYNVQVMDLNGKIMVSEYNKGQSGNNKIKLNLAQLSAGVYVVNVNAEGLKASTKLMKR